ncbi:MAG: hypothetical protein JKY41_14320 [Rhodobacteraceae bacterium]|nr:hypothetical protein [Paracoccaceae bacterium]
MQDNSWVPQVLKDIEKYCHKNDLSKVAFYLEDARRKFEQFQDEEKAAITGHNENIEPLRLVWSQPSYLVARRK